MSAKKAVSSNTPEAVREAPLLLVVVLDAVAVLVFDAVPVLEPEAAPVVVAEAVVPEAVPAAEVAAEVADPDAVAPSWTEVLTQDWLDPDWMLTACEYACTPVLSVKAIENDEPAERSTIQVTLVPVWAAHCLIAGAEG